MGEILFGFALKKKRYSKTVNLDPTVPSLRSACSLNTDDWQLFIARQIEDELAGSCCVQGDAAHNDKDFEKIFQNSVSSFYAKQKLYT